jgi:hypothetical protein
MKKILIKIISFIKNIFSKTNNKTSTDIINEISHSYTKILEENNDLVLNIFPKNEFDKLKGKDFGEISYHDLVRLSYIAEDGFLSAKSLPEEIVEFIKKYKKLPVDSFYDFANILYQLNFKFAIKFDEKTIINKETGETVFLPTKSSKVFDSENFYKDYLKEELEIDLIMNDNKIEKSGFHYVTKDNQLINKEQLNQHEK